MNNVLSFSVTIFLSEWNSVRAPVAESPAHSLSLSGVVGSNASQDVPLSRCPVGL